MRKLLPILLVVPFLTAWQPPMSWKLNPSETAPPSQPAKAPYVCASSGEFNLNNARDQLALETYCFPLQVKKGQAMRMLKIPDRKVHKTEGISGKASLFQVPFRNAVVTVFTRRSGAVLVQLHYQDASGAMRKRILPKRESAYAYSFSDLVPGQLKPHKEKRFLTGK